MICADANDRGRTLLAAGTEYTCNTCGEDLSAKSANARIKHIRACTKDPKDKASVGRQARLAPAKKAKTGASMAGGPQPVAVPVVSSAGCCNLCGHTNRAADSACGIIADSAVPCDTESLAFAIGEIDTALRRLRDRFVLLAPIRRPCTSEACACMISAGVQFYGEP